MTNVEEVLERLAKETDATWNFSTGGKQIEETDIELIYSALALAGEAGELANKAKKHFRLKYLTGGHADPDALKGIPEELVDIVYYALRVARTIGIDADAAWKDKMAINIKRYVGSK